jgi:hypothetical protein
MRRRAALGFARVGARETKMTFDGFWITFIAGLFGTLIGSIATIIAAMISRQPTLATVIDARIAVLMQIYEKTIGELRTEISRTFTKGPFAICAITFDSLKRKSMF